MTETVLVGVGGGIAAYKSISLCSQLVKQGLRVRVVMTPNAQRFVQPLTFQSITHEPVLTDVFSEPNAQEIAHIAWADLASVYVIAPATADLIGKLAAGIADDPVTTVALAVQAPILIAPSMNVHMWSNEAVKENISLLEKRGILILTPNSGPLACGYNGPGRLPEPEEIAAQVVHLIRRSRDLVGLHLLITAGPTVEDLDPVRFLSNASSGKMGYALAEAGIARGAEVTLVSGPVHLNPVVGARVIGVRSTQQMLTAVMQHWSKADVLIAAAAPADFRPVSPFAQKWKKSDGVPVLALEPTPDILANATAVKKIGQSVVGFAAETRDLVKYGMDKLERKKLDLVVINDVTEPGAGFAGDTNHVILLRRNGTLQDIPLVSKRVVADAILDEVINLRTAQDFVVGAQET